MEIELRLSPDDSEIASIYEGLKEFNLSQLPDLQEHTLGIFVRDANQKILGGLIAKHIYTSIHINYLWLSPSIRHQGFGNTLLDKLETYGLAQKAERLFVDTYSFQAPSFYEKCGFTETGRYINFPKAGIDKIFYSKTIG